MSEDKPYFEHTFEGRSIVLTENEDGFLTLSVAVRRRAEKMPDVWTSVDLDEDAMIRLASALQGYLYTNDNPWPLPAEGTRAISAAEKVWREAVQAARQADYSWADIRRTLGVSQAEDHS